MPVALLRIWDLGCFAEVLKELESRESPKAVISIANMGSISFSHGESRSKLLSLVPTLERRGRSSGNNKSL